MAKSNIKRVSTMRLSPGMHTVLNEYEGAVRRHAVFHHTIGSDPELDQDDIAEVDEAFDKLKQRMLRKLLRIQNGEEYTDFEAMKKDLRTMCRVIRNIQMAPQQAVEILHSSPSTLKVVADVIDHRRRL